jgi:predicted enzyme related to lactoylglutathione lyase
MEIGICSVLVDDQENALRVYTELLGFIKKSDIPVGDFRWITVVSRNDPEGIELLLEPNVHPAARAYQEAIYEDGIPATMFFVDDLKVHHEQLSERGVVFSTPPTETEQMTFAVIDDTCGNLIQLVER